jgi:predicted dehydrogenase
MVRLGVVGYGQRLNGVVQHNLRALAPDLAVVGIVDPDRAGVTARLAERDRADVVFYDDLPTLVRQGRLDALAIGTRCNLHAGYAIQAAAYDLPLFLEKPVAIQMEQALALERAFASSRCQVVVSFPLRVSPLCGLARRYVAEGQVGTPVHVTALNYVPYGTVYWEEPYRNWEITGGLFLQKATHDLDYLMYLMGEPIVRVAATRTVGKVFGGTKPAGLVCSACADQDTCPESPGNRRRHGTSGTRADHPCLYSVDCGTAAANTLNEDCSSTLLEFASGAHGIYTQVFFTRRDAATRGATVSGYQGTVSFDWYTNQLRHVRHHAPFSATEVAGEGASHFGGDLELARDFLDLIAGRSPSRTPIQTGLQSVYACLAAQQSAEQGCFQNVRHVGGEG